MRSTVFTLTVVLLCFVFLAGAGSLAKVKKEQPAAAEEQAKKAHKKGQKGLDPAAGTPTENGPGQNRPIQSSPAMAGEQINWWVISAGGTDGASTSYKLMGTVGQTAVGSGNSASYRVSHGFWPDFGPAGCCVERGDLDHNGNVDIADILYFVEFSFGSPPGPAPVCDEGGYYPEADLDANMTVDIADLLYFVEYSFGSPPGPAPLPC